MSALDSIHDVDPNQWNNLVEQSDLGSVFQRHEWLALTEDTVAEYEPLHVVVSKGENPVAVLPNVVRPVHVPGDPALVDRLPAREAVSLQPGFGGPIVGARECECLPLLFDELESTTGPGVLYHTIRGSDTAYGRYAKWLAKRGYEPTNVNCRFRLHLDRGWEALRENMHSSRRRAIDAVEDVSVRERTCDASTARDTYPDYAANVERVGGEPYPFEFYEALVTEFSERVLVVTASHDGEDVGSYLYLLDDEQDTVHYWFAAVPDETCYEHNVSEALHRYGIEWGIDEGYRYYDFGATGAHFDDGVFRYKARYGGELVLTPQWQRGHSRAGWMAFKTGRRLYRLATY
ncbi:lipid II:glycine glycyltransferase FemX [Haloarchaeobius sp. HRN-SO-5]|uniref:lipid II:glycine glycyltransferase FemX n=1 Tax=Haloarchaeobius sp. HRN-SO-5 TaxID=3446118 RepID=UPI003EBB298E